jgi:hypothetical protein
MEVFVLAWFTDLKFLCGCGFSGVRMGEIDLCADLTVCIIGKIPSFVPAITFQLVNSKGNNALPPSIFKFH